MLKFFVGACCGRITADSGTAATSRHRDSPCFQLSSAHRVSQVWYMTLNNEYVLNIQDLLPMSCTAMLRMVGAAWMGAIKK